MNDFPIIDSHHHLYDRDTNFSPLLATGVILHEKLMGNASKLIKNYLIEDYLADARPHNVVKSVHIESDWDAADAVGQSRWIQGLADKHGFPHGIVGYADLEAPDVEAVLEGNLEYPNFRGIRQFLFWHDNPDLRMVDDPSTTPAPAPSRADVMQDPAWRRGYGLLERYGLSFDHGISYSQLSQAAALIRDYPGVACVINHLGYPCDRKEDQVEVWRAGIREVATCPNAMMKMSGIFMTDHDWTVDSIRPFVLEAIDAFGPERCMFASNFPVDELYGSYEDILNAFKEVVKDFSKDEKRELFHDTAARFYRLG